MSKLNSIDPEFSKAGKENPFAVPEGYFDSLPSRIQEYCQVEKTDEQPLGWIYILRSQLTLAVGFVALGLLAYFGYYIAQPVNRYNKTDYVNIVERHVSGFDEADIYDALFYGGREKQDSLGKLRDEDFIKILYRNNIDNVTLIRHSKEIKP